MPFGLAGAVEMGSVPFPPSTVPAPGRPGAPLRKCQNRPYGVGISRFCGRVGSNRRARRSPPVLPSDHRRLRAQGAEHRIGRGDQRVPGLDFHRLGRRARNGLPQQAEYRRWSPERADGPGATVLPGFAQGFDAETGRLHRSRLLHPRRTTAQTVIPFRAARAFVRLAAHLLRRRLRVERCQALKAAQAVGRLPGPVFRNDA